jgi:mannosyltransferase
MQPSQAASTTASGVPAESARKTPWPFLVALLAAGLAVRLLWLTSKPFWFDECFSVEVARLDWRDFLHLLWWREANMSLYYVLLRIWLYFGQSPFFIRALSAILATATVPAIYWLGRLLYDRRVGLIACALFTFNAFSIRYAQEARSYALLVLLATLSSCLLIGWLRQPDRNHWHGFVLASILAVYAHFYALLLLAAQWLALRHADGLMAGNPHQREDRRRAWITIGLAVLPLLVFVAKTGAGPIRWIQRPGLRDVLDLYEHLAGTNSWPLLAIIGAACVAALIPAGRELLAKAPSWQAWRCQFLLLWLIFPVALTVLLSWARPVFLGRYMIFCLPAFLVLASAGLARLRAPWLLGSAMGVILLLCLPGISFVYGHDFDNERDASGAATNFILDHTEAGDAILFHIAATRVPYEFFRSLRAGQNSTSPKFTPQSGPETLFPRHGSGLDYRDFTGKPSVELLHTAAPAYTRVWVMLMNNGPAGNPDPTTGMLLQVLPQSFPKVQSWHFAKVDLLLYSRQ